MTRDQLVALIAGITRVHQWHDGGNVFVSWEDALESARAFVVFAEAHLRETEPQKQTNGATEIEHTITIDRTNA